MFFRCKVADLTYGRAMSTMIITSVERLESLFCTPSLPKHISFGQWPLSIGLEWLLLYRQLGFVLIHIAFAPKNSTIACNVKKVLVEVMISTKLGLNTSESMKWLLWCSKILMGKKQGFLIGTTNEFVFSDEQWILSSNQLRDCVLTFLIQYQF